MPTLTQDDQDKIIAILTAGGHKLRPNSVSIDDNAKLWFRIEGNDTAGVEAIKTLRGAGLAMVDDRNMATNENGAIWNDGARFCKCWVQLIDGPLFRV